MDWQHVILVATSFATSFTTRPLPLIGHNSAMRSGRCQLSVATCILEVSRRDAHDLPWSYSMRSRCSRVPSVLLVHALLARTQCTANHGPLKIVTEAQRPSPPAFEVSSFTFHTRCPPLYCSRCMTATANWTDPHFSNGINAHFVQWLTKHLV